MKFDIDFIDEQVTNYFVTKVDDFCKKYPDRAGSMVGDFVTTKNLFIQSHDDNFHEMVDAIKSVIEKKINKELMYRYVHMLDYTGGGELLVHTHDHVEDYVYILYLNTCEDGATYFVEDDQKLEVFPEANKLVHYPASLPHGARYSSTKKVLVGGLVFS